MAATFQDMVVLGLDNGQRERLGTPKLFTE